MNNSSLTPTPKAQTTGENLDKLDFIKVKSFCVSRHYKENEKTKGGENIYKLCTL
jgi:hypothetical protein